MKTKNHKSEASTERRELGTMLAKLLDGCVLKGGREIAIKDYEQLRAQFNEGAPVLPPRMYMLDEKGPGTGSPAETVFEKMARDGRLRIFMQTFFKWPEDDGLGNAHEVAEALMLDLILARASEGWRWVMADVERDWGRDRHSWLEYKGWSVNAAYGQVKIWPAWYYRAISDARKFTIRDAAQVRADWRKSNTRIDGAIEAALSRPPVRIYDFATKKITEIPLSELPPGLVSAQVDGVEGLVWIDPVHLEPNTQYFHPPFPPAVRREIGRIAEALQEVVPMSQQEWEDGIRRDRNAKKQIFLFTCIAEAYRRMTDKSALTQVQKMDYYQAITSAARSGDSELFMATFRATAISQYEALAAAEMYGRVIREKDGLAKLETWEADLQMDGTPRPHEEPTAAA